MGETRWIVFIIIIVGRSYLYEGWGFSNLKDIQPFDFIN
jgi:hypothetical protein